MSHRQLLFSILVLVFSANFGRAQFISFGGGGMIARDLKDDTTASGAIIPVISFGPPPNLAVRGTDRADFSSGPIMTIDAGTGLLPFLTGGLHYSYARPDLALKRGDAFGSSAQVDLGAHTLTFDTRFRTPHYAGYRLFGQLGAGFTRFSLAVKEAVEVPFPGGAPDKTLSPVLTYGGGVERSISPLLHLKLEVRDYLTGVSDQLYRPRGASHRIAITAGIVIGR